MAFELFQKKSGRKTSGPRVTIAKQGALRINAACLAEHFDGVEFVQLLFDPKRRCIGLKPAAADDENTYKICRSKQGGAAISGLAFLTHYKINHNETRAYPVKWAGNPGAVVIALK